MWIAEYMPDGWNDDPRDGYVVYNVDTDKQKTGYAYYPTGKEQAEKFAKLCNDLGEAEACKLMGYKGPDWTAD